MTNKTSEVVEQYVEDIGDYWPSVREKYLRMAEYLGVIHKESNRHFKGDEFTEVNDILRNIYMHASGAIEFDPLNSSSPNSLISSAQ